MMSIISLKTMLFCVVAALALAGAALGAPTVLPPAESGSGQKDTTTEATAITDSTTTTDSEGQASFVPVFQCAANTGEAANVKSVAELFGGLVYVRPNILVEITTKANECPDESIRDAVHLNSDTASLHDKTSILQAYSGIALLATETEGISEGDRRRMLAIHEMLNALIQNHFKVISPSHCSCPGSDTANCTKELRDLFQELDITHARFDKSCSPADYLSKTLPRELEWMRKQFQKSPTYTHAFRLNHFSHVNCTTWKDQYIPADSSAYSEFRCDL